MTRSLAAVFFVGLFAGVACAQTSPAGAGRGDRMIAAYFEAETARLRDACLAGVAAREAWEARRPELLAQLREMLSLDPLPEKTDLHATVTGQLERDGLVVEKLHFQSRPGLYVTANVYRPAKIEGRLPAVLYVCGHAGVKKGDVSFGNKVAYQHHGVWFARNGYVCLVLDSLQLGEIEGIHHGTYRYGMWWWLNRGYTPAGVEAWNCIRALDYLETRGDVDPARLGVTGRSGGGAYSWWIAALDERIRAAVPVAGITDLENHVVDGTVEGHCDCMFFVNTYQWDYPQVAALVAPRALMITNTDADSIFPVDGVWRTYEKTRRVYALCGAVDRLGLTITPGPHQDTPELRQGAFRWLNRFLRDQDPDVQDYPDKPFQPEELRVFGDLPADQVNTRVQETFVPEAALPPVPQTREAWAAVRDGWLKALSEKTFRSWPPTPEDPAPQQAFQAERDGLRLRGIDFTSQGAIRLRLYVVEPAGAGRPEEVRLIALDQAGWNGLLAWLRPAFQAELADEAAPPSDAATADGKDLLADGKTALVFVAPRGVGPTAWNGDEKKQTQIRRRFMLLGQTLDGQRVWDVRRAIQAARTLEGYGDARLVVQAAGPMAGVALYASLFEPNVAGLELAGLPASHRDGPYLLNVNRILDIPGALALAAERSPVHLRGCPAEAARFAEEVSRACGWGERRVRVE